MERLTEKHYKASDGYYMKCSGTCGEGCCDGCPKSDEFVDRLGQLEDILGDTYDLDRLRELVEADKDERCVVFPCKPSDATVYQLRNKKHALGPGVHPRHIYCATVWSNGRHQLEHQGYEPCRDRDFGKTWFLTEEAAEAALAKEASHE